MEIRGIRESEFEEMIDLICLTFRPGEHERYWQYIRGDSSYRQDQTRIVVVNGRIASTLRVWERSMRIGSCILRMAGIGGVCTHPEYRGVGYATALMKDTIAYMRTMDYNLGVLFSEIPYKFYRNLGWANVPLAGFRVTRRGTNGLSSTGWQVDSFDEKRDLEQVIALYDTYNAQQSGSIVRSKAYWNDAPSRIRNILPSVVARRGNTVGGYINFQIEAVPSPGAGTRANVLEVAHDRTDAAILIALTKHLLQVCEQQDVEDISGEIPHQHPLADLLVEGSAGDLILTGNTSMMLTPVNIQLLLRRLLPDLQSRLDTSNQQCAPISICFTVNNQQGCLRLHNSGKLEVHDADAAAIQLTLPQQIFWRALLGESSWSQLEPTLHTRGIPVTPKISALLSILFPQQHVIFWGPDHY